MIILGMALAIMCVGCMWTGIAFLWAMEHADRKRLVQDLSIEEDAMADTIIATLQTTRETMVETPKSPREITDEEIDAFVAGFGASKHPEAGSDEATFFLGSYDSNFVEVK
jgi:hypothetical protein